MTKRIENGARLDEANKLKHEKLLDIIRRVIANPQHAKDAVDEIAIDWFPVFRVDQKGNFTIIVGSDRKK